MNLPEIKLRSWQPRRPSAGLKHRIFAAPPVTSRIVVWSLRCLTPAAACLLVTLALLNHGGSVTSGPPRRDFLAAVIGSNEIAYLPGNYQQEQNGYSPVIFEWTNRSGSTFSIGSRSPGKVN